jgi:hypothetical protein
MKTYPHNRRAAESRYTELRNIALMAVRADLKAKGLVATTITTEALREIESWGKSKTRPYDWDWRAERAHFFCRYPKRFEIALWQSNKVIAVSLGRPTFNSTGMRLDVVEGRPKDLEDRPPIIKEILFAYEVYARLLGANHIRIMKPANEELKAFYQGLGYAYIEKYNYLTKEIF